MKKVAAYCMTRNLYDISVASIKSLLKNSDVEVVYLLIEDDEFPVKLPRTKVINVSDQKFFRPDGPNWDSQFTYMAMMRAALPKILKESRVLSLDCDTIIDGDISELWELPLNDYYFAAGKETHKSVNGRLYVNVGVAMYNLSKLRKDKMTDRIINALNTKLYGFVEQDCLNELCEGHILEMPPEYNVTYWSVKTDKPAVITHYAGHRDWSGFDLYKKYAAIEVKK